MSFLSGEDVEEDDPFFLTVNVRCATGQKKEFPLKVEATATVDQFKQQIRNHLHLSEDQNLRLIFNGKLLGPGSSTVESTEIRNNCFIHAVISPKRTETTGRNNESSNESIVGDEDEGGRVVDGRGLNSLLMSVEGDARQRLSREQVGALRAYFSSSIREYTERHLSRGEAESEQDFSMRAETEWMAAQPPHSEFRLNLSIAATHAFFRSSAGGGTGLTFIQYESGASPDRSNDVGTCRDFFFGMALGYSLGFMMVFCVWDANVSYRQKLGILTGIILQLVLGMMFRKSLSETNSSSRSSTGSLRGSDPSSSTNSSPI